MRIYLIDSNTKETLTTFTNVLIWDYTFVEYDNNGYRNRTYAVDNTYFTDKLNKEIENG